MKKFLFVVFLFFGCSNDFLEVPPDSGVVAQDSGVDAGALSRVKKIEHPEIYKPTRLPSLDAGAEQ